MELKSNFQSENFKVHVHRHLGVTLNETPEDSIFPLDYVKDLNQIYCGRSLDMNVSKEGK
jgi:hypothetical protein